MYIQFNIISVPIAVMFYKSTQICKSFLIMNKKYEL